MSSDLKPKQPPLTKSGKPKAAPKPQKGNSDSPIARPVNSSWITKVAHRQGLCWVYMKSGYRYGYSDRTGKHYDALVKANKKGASVGQAYWRRHLRDKSFIKRRA